MNKKNKKVRYNRDKDEPKIKALKTPRKKRHNSKENLKDIAKGNLDYDDYMEMEEWSDPR